MSSSTTTSTAHRPSHLTTVMEEPAPPVPPKDPEYQNHTASSMDIDRPPTARSSAPASGSKRKRDTFDDHDYRNARLEVTDGEDNGHTPSKRSRSHVRSDGDYDLSDETPAQQRNLRRKNGVRNLSNLNLRHAASVQKLPRPQHSPPRESKFQEGSLNDKPSEKPPSVFTRLPRSDSANLEYVDELMADYHDPLPTPSGSVEQVIEHEKAMMPQRVAEINAQKENENPGMFRFGKSWTSNFHPVALWNRLWNDTKDELTRQNMLDAEKKARTKAEAEARYAQLKSAGQLGLQPVSAAASYDLLSTPYDSAVALDNGTGAHRRNVSGQLRASNDTSRDGSEAPEPPRTIRGRLSRLHLRKPSMSSLTSTIKRTRSDFNLAGAAERESSSSVSPTKATFDGGGSLLRRSHSKYDLKKQNRLSKRVSDLESKLNKARAELDSALAEASPAPKLGSKYERFTPVGTMKRSKFIPGALPTLPSERLLFQDMNKSQANLAINGTMAVTDRRPRNAIDLSKAFDDIDDDETVKPSRNRTYPARAQDLFPEPDKQPDEDEAPTDELAIPDHVEDKAVEAGAGALDTHDNAVPESTNKPVSDILDAKLKALDASVKAGKKSAKSKKRSRLNKDDSGSFKPGRADDADDDDAEWEEAEKSTKKKRKSVGEPKNSPQTKRANAGGKQKSPHKKLVKRNTAVSTRSKKKASGAEDSTNAHSEHAAEDVEMVDTLESEDELAKNSSRNSIDAETQSLEPLYEEEEDMSTQQLKDEPSKPTAIATPAKYGRNAVRSRSNSPHKRAEPGAEEKMMVRAAKAAVQSRPTRSASPPANAYSTSVEVVNETVSVVPGKDGVPNLPTGANGSFESLGNAEQDVVMVKKGGRKKQVTKENFEWPDDVF